MIYNDMRPHRFDDVKGQTLVVENIRNQSKKNRFFPVFILCGQYGSGKTTMQGSLPWLLIASIRMPMAIPVGNVIPAGQSLTIPRRAL